MTATRRDLVKTIAAVPVLAATPLPMHPVEASESTFTDLDALMVKRWHEIIDAMGNAECSRIQLDYDLRQAASTAGMIFTRDPEKWSRWIVATPNNARVEYAECEHCTCDRFSRMRYCEHVAMVRQLFEDDPDAFLRPPYRKA